MTRALLPAVLMLLVALYAKDGLAFTSFPTILLVTTLYRLALNVSSTKLIIGQGHTGPDAAGGVIALKFLLKYLL